MTGDHIIFVKGTFKESFGIHVPTPDLESHSHDTIFTFYNNLLPRSSWAKYGARFFMFVCLVVFWGGE